MTILCSPSELRGRPTAWFPCDAADEGRERERRRRPDQQPDVRVTRWTDGRSEARRETVTAPEGQLLLVVALTPTHVRLLNGLDLIFDGMMMSGMTYICRPAQTLQAEYTAAADFLHLYVAADAIGEPAAANANLDAIDEALLATMISRDALIDHLARALQMAGDGADARYIATLARALVMRLMQISRGRGRASPLPKWRLKRVIDHIDAHISEAISLSDMATAAGLSRMHFAAQFRLATGSKPHDFVLLQRIEAAKRLLIYTSNDLVEIALAVGFQAQAHFSTVFKRLVGETPGRWRRARLAERSPRRWAAHAFPHAEGAAPGMVCRAADEEMRHEDPTLDERLNRRRDAPRGGAMCVALALGLCASAAHAADEEIQVYIDDMSAKGAYGLDVHVNDVLQGRGANVDYAGQQASQGRVRITPEWAYGLTSNVELGAYLPLMTFDDHGRAEIAGVKGRIKFIAPRGADDPFFWGLNFEIGRVRRDIDINPWNAELKGIAGYRAGPWTFAENLNVDWAVSGPSRGPVTYQLATMVTRKIADGLDVGFESYNGLGDARGFGRLGQNDQELFAIVDKSFGKWDLNLGVGTGYGRPEDRLLFKAIIGVPIG